MLIDFSSPKSALFYYPFSMMAILFFSCKNNSDEVKKAWLKSCKCTPSDTIGITAIGNQLWMAENLNVVTFQNGDTIPEAASERAWEVAYEKKQPAWCYFFNEKAIGNCFGKLYNWYAIHDARHLEPEGWKIASYADWQTLEETLGGDTLAGEIMKSIQYWPAENIGIDAVGFAALPGGYRNGFSQFEGIGAVGAWWCPTHARSPNSTAYAMEVWGESSALHHVGGPGTANGSLLRYGFAVRCVKDIPAAQP